jgi:hypothetical protein
VAGTVAVATTVDSAPASYRPGVFSRALAWMDSLPSHGWWIFPVSLGLLFAWTNGVLWATGLLPFGTIDPVSTLSTVYAPYTLLAIGYINRSSERALDAFWPATGWPESKKAAWRYDFMTSPGGYDLPTFVIGLLVAIAGFVSISPSALLPGATVLAGTDRVIVFAAYLPVALLGYWLLLLALLHTTRQLRLVSRIHREASAIDPFDRAPIYAFSGLTVRTGLIYGLSGYYALVVNGAFQAGNVAVVVVLVAVLGVGITSFVVPLWGIHQRLVVEKDRMLRAVDRRMRAAGARLYEHVDAGEFDAGKPINDTLSGLRIVRDRFRELPTWPWPPNLLRGFLTALLLPVIVYILSRFAAGSVGL